MSAKRERDQEESDCDSDSSADSFFVVQYQGIEICDDIDWGLFRGLMESFEESLNDKINSTTIEHLILDFPAECLNAFLEKYWKDGKYLYDQNNHDYNDHSALFACCFTHCIGFDMFECVKKNGKLSKVLYGKKTIFDFISDYHNTAVHLSPFGAIEPQTGYRVVRFTACDEPFVCLVPESVYQDVCKYVTSNSFWANGLHEERKLNTIYQKMCNYMDTVNKTSNSAELYEYLVHWKCFEMIDDEWKIDFDRHSVKDIYNSCHICFVHAENGWCEEF